MCSSDLDGTPKESLMNLIDLRGNVLQAVCQWRYLKKWKSPRTNVEYPSLIRITSKNSFFELRPLAIDQEQIGKKTGIIYWEGICEVFNQHGISIGKAFLEMVRDLKGHR